MTYDNTPLRLIRQEIARLVNRTIIATPAADSTRLTGRIIDQRWDFALKSMLDAHELEGVEDTTGIIFIKTVEQARKEAANLPMHLRVLKLQRPATPVAVIARRLLSPSGWLEVDTMTNTIVLSERSDLIDRVVLTILELNRPPSP